MLPHWPQPLVPSTSAHYSRARIAEAYNLLNQRKSLDDGKTRRRKSGVVFFIFFFYGGEAGQRLLRWCSWLSEASGPLLGLPPLSLIDKSAKPALSRAKSVRHPSSRDPTHRPPKCQFPPEPSFTFPPLGCSLLFLSLSLRFYIPVSFHRL